MLDFDNEFNQPEKILVILSARLNQFYSFYYELPLALENYQISVLCQKRAADSIPEASINKFITKDAEISLDNLEPEIKGNLLKAEYGSLVILYNNREGSGYDQVDKLAGTLKAGNKYVYDIDGRLFKFDDDFLHRKNVIRPAQHREDVRKAQKTASELIKKITSSISSQQTKPEKPRIIFLTAQGFDLPAARVRCFFLAEELAKLGWQTETISLVTHLGFPEEWDQNLSEKMTANSRLVDILSTKSNYILYLQRLDYHAWVVKELFEKRGLPFIFDYDDWDLDFLPLPEIFKPHFPDGESLLKFFIQNSLLNVVSSKYLENHFRKTVDETLYLPTGVATSNFNAHSPTTAGDTIKISWLGTVMRLSNLNDLIFSLNAFQKISVQYPQTVLEILASGRYLKRARSFARDNQQIKFRGWTAPGEVAGYLGTIDIGLLPLIENNPFNRSKSPTKLFEYMCLGKAVLASAVGEANYIIEDGVNGFLFQDEGEFIDKLKILIEDNGLRKKMGLNARATIIDKYTLAKQAKKLSDKLESRLG